MRTMATTVAAFAFLVTAPMGQATSSATTQIDHGTRVLIWLKTHPRPGTPRSRAAVQRRFMTRVVSGLRRIGVWNGFLCIHDGRGASWGTGEGSWRDSGDPYWGGLQMDRGFMSSYGRDFMRAYHGYADRWPPWAQIVVGYRAWLSRRFGPWPNTARACNLL